jgi:hypothetical protein
MNTLSKRLLFVALAIVFLSACNQVAPATTANLPTPTITLTSTAQPTAQPKSTEASTEAFFSSMGFGRMPWGISLSGDNKVCFTELRSNPRACDGNTLKITAKSPLLVLKNGEIFLWLKVNDAITMQFDRDTSYDFYGLADRKYPFYGEWRSTMFMWSDSSKTFPILMLPQNEGNDQFVDLASGIIYDFPANSEIFDYTVSSPIFGHLYCNDICVFNP